MISNVYVVYDEVEKKYELPFFNTSDRGAVSIFYSRIHNFRNSLDANLGFKQYSYKLYCLGEIESGAIFPDSLPYFSLQSPRLVAVSNFVVEEKED